jgi:transcriptional regulator with XRE-family HTH domain
MKKNAIFEQCIANVAPEVMEEVSLNVDIANRIYDLLKARNISQRKFAELMGKRESEISRWLTGRHGFTTNTLAKISSVLGEPIIEVKSESKTKYEFIPIVSLLSPCKVAGGKFVIKKGENSFSMDYKN